MLADSRVFGQLYRLDADDSRDGWAMPYATVAPGGELTNAAGGYSGTGGDVSVDLGGAYSSNGTLKC